MSEMKQTFDTAAMIDRSANGNAHSTTPLGLDHIVESSAQAEHWHKDPDHCHSGAVIGTLTGFDETGQPLVATGEFENQSFVARVAVDPKKLIVGNQVVVLFERCDPTRPILIGKLFETGPVTDSVEVEAEIQLPVLADENLQADVDDDRLVFKAKREIVLKCGKASLTLTRAGKVLIRGAYVSSRSSGVNRIKGGSVQIN